MGPVQATVYGDDDLKKIIRDIIREEIFSALSSFEIKEREDEYLTIKQAAELLKVSRQQVYNLTDQGELRKHDFGKARRYKRSEIMEYWPKYKKYERRPVQLKNCIRKAIS